ncbi:unnamed protein product, partial [Mesorhabditis spiculigera]
MIGMVNVPCDSMREFYAAPTDTPAARCQPVDGVKVEPEMAVKLLTNRPLFNRRHAEHIDYTKDGRKMSNGEVLQKHNPNKLWEELLIRTFAKKVEDEVKNPVEGMRQLEAGMETLRGSLDKTQSNSMFSLVSDHRLMAEIAVAEDVEEEERLLKRIKLSAEPADELEDEEHERHRSASTVSHPISSKRLSISKLSARRTKSSTRTASH